MLSELYMKKNSLNFLLLLLIIIALPVIILIVTDSSRRPFDMRPKALTGQANLTLIADTASTNVDGQVTVIVKAALTNPQLRMSGADITLLYDKTKLQLVDAEPATAAGRIMSGPFTDAPIVNLNVPVDSQFAGIRLAQVINRASSALPGGVIDLGKAIFRATAPGAATIKFPSDTSTMQIVGVQLP